MSEGKDNTIDKAETINKKSVIRPLTNSERGQPRVVTSARFVQDARNEDLAMPRRICALETMYQSDDAVFNSVDVTNLPVLMALSKGEFIPGPSNSSVSKAAADFMNYNIRNLSFGTWMEVINNANTDIIYGWSTANIVTEIRNKGKYKGMRVLKKISPRSQKSLYGWVWDKDFRELKGMVQKPNLKKNRDSKLSQFNGEILLGDLMNQFNYHQNYPFIRSDQLLHFKYNPVDNNPQGDSPLLHCYDAYVEKKLVEQYEIVGVTKDLGGSVVLRVPSWLIERASNPSQYPDEAREYEALQDNAAALQSGESAFILLASDVDRETKVRDFDIEFKGIDGGGKQYQTSDIIDQKRKSIYNVFGAGFLLLGQNGPGSYALSASQNTTHGFYVQRNILWKKDVLDNQLVPTLLLANNIFLDWKDMPVFQPADPDEMDLEIASKAIQRMKSVGGMTPSAIEHVYRKLGWPTDGIEDLVFDDGDTSRAGESKGSSGTGNSQQGGIGSAVNSENVSKAKKLTVDGDYIIDTDTGLILNYQDINPETGEYK